MDIKNLTFFNTKAKPWFTENIYSKSKLFRQVLSSELPKATNDNQEIYLIVLNETYGYRTGLLGYIFTYLSNTNIYKPNFLTKLLNKSCFVSNSLHTNDYDIISFFLSRLTSLIPIINYGFWDYKYVFNNILKYKTVNNSYPSIFNLFSPYLDNGICFFSNKKPYESGFKKLNTINSSLQDNITNRGIEWLVFRNNEKVVIVITFNLSDNLDDTIKLQEIYQIVYQYDLLEEKYKNKIIETYILGDFKLKISHQIKNIFHDFICVNTEDKYNYLFFKAHHNISVTSSCSDFSVKPIINFDIKRNNHHELKEVIIEKESCVNEEKKSTVEDENNKQKRNTNAIKLQKFFKYLVEKRKKVTSSQTIDIVNSIIFSNYFDSKSEDEDHKEEEKEVLSPSSFSTDESWDKVVDDEIAI